jgi:hypothetical protein
MDWLIQEPTLGDTVWPATSWPQALPSGVNTTLYWNYFPTPTSITTNTATVNSPLLLEEHCDINTMPAGGPYVRRTADTEVELVTGGPLGSRQQNVWVISASATDVATGKPIPYAQISVGSFGNLGMNGCLYVTLLDNAQYDITARVLGNDDYTFSSNGQK